MIIVLGLCRPPGRPNGMGREELAALQRKAFRANEAAGMAGRWERPPTTRFQGRGTLLSFFLSQSLLVFLLNQKFHFFVLSHIVKTTFF